MYSVEISSSHKFTKYIYLDKYSICLCGDGLRPSNDAISCVAYSLWRCALHRLANKSTLAGRSRNNPVLCMRLYSYIYM